MKTLFITIFITLLPSVHAGLDNCFREAKTHGSITSPLSPAEECSDLIKSHADKVEFKNKNLHLYGLGDMLYVENKGKRELLAGDQTELKDILKIEVNELKDRFIVLQKDSVATYRLSFVGNVTPISYFKSPIVKNASKVKLLDNEDMLAIFSSSIIRIINSDAETRYKIEKTKPKLLNEISGEGSQLKSPTDILFSVTEQKFFVLDSDRLLVFPSSVKKDQSPLKIIKIDEARSLIQKENLIFYVNTKGQETQVNIAD